MVDLLRIFQGVEGIRNARQQAQIMRERMALEQQRIDMAKAQFGFQQEQFQEKIRQFDLQGRMREAQAAKAEADAMQKFTKAETDQFNLNTQRELQQLGRALPILQNAARLPAPQFQAALPEIKSQLSALAETDQTRQLVDKIQSPEDAAMLSQQLGSWANALSQGTDARKITALKRFGLSDEQIRDIYMKPGSVTNIRVDTKEKKRLDFFDAPADQGALYTDTMREVAKLPDADLRKQAISEVGDLDNWRKMNLTAAKIYNDFQKIPNRSLATWFKGSKSGREFASAVASLTAIYRRTMKGQGTVSDQETFLIDDMIAGKLDTPQAVEEAKQAYRRLLSDVPPMVLVQSNARGLELYNKSVEDVKAAWSDRLSPAPRRGPAPLTPQKKQQALDILNKYR